MASESEFESDAGASPSESDSSSTSSRASSPGALKIVCEPAVAQSTSRKKNNTNYSTVAGTSVRRPTVKKNRLQFAQKSSSETTNTLQKELSTKSLKTSLSVVQRKRKHRPELGKKSWRGSISSNEFKRRRVNQRRRTKSERNTRAHLTTDESTTAVEKLQLDAAIDEILEEKAIKNNLTATNVKSIIRHVITNNMVQKMLMSTCRKKGTNPDDSSDDEACYEPKLTRARTKLLFGNESTSSTMWPLASPVKLKAPGVSETQVLIQAELPEDSSGDEEYVPQEGEAHSDDESSSIASHASDNGSPRISTPGTTGSQKKQRNRNVLDFLSPKTDSSVFKTPPPIKPKCARRLDSAIGLRTRSKLPLNDTPLEDLEMQLIPPDITTDMYDWGLDDNEDYLTFVKEFLCPGQNVNESNEVCDDEEADPEYNHMEEEEVHDKEELRMDRAVKVTKKELNLLFAELLDESHFTSGDELDESDFTSFCTSQFMSVSNIQQLSNSGTSINTPPPKSKISASIDELPDCRQRFQQDILDIGKKSSTTLRKDVATGSSEPVVRPSLKHKSARSPHPSEATTAPLSNTSSMSESSFCISPIKQPTLVLVQSSPSKSECFSETCNSSEETLRISNSDPPHPMESVELFSNSIREILKYQLRIHTQLLAQSYALTAKRDEPEMRSIASGSKKMIIDLKNLGSQYGDKSIIASIENIFPAWQLVNSWPVKPSNRSSPIKKKILVEQYHNEFNTNPSNTFGRTFPDTVAKVIVESAAFIFPLLLPLYYDQNQYSDKPLHFTSSEDILLIYGLDQLKSYKLTTKSRAKIISEVILTARTPEAVYHHIKYIKKTKYHGSKEVKEYFSNQILPLGALTPPPWDSRLAVAPIHQTGEKAPLLWTNYISSLIVPSSIPQKLLGDLITTPPTYKRKVRKRNTLKTLKSPGMNKSNTKDIITSTFPVGTGAVQQKLSDTPNITAFPLFNASGNPELYVFVPNYALTAPGYNNSPKGTEAQEGRKYYHPIPFYERDVAPTISNTGDAQTNSNGEAVISLTPIGKPFALEGVSNDIIDLSTFNTPMKRAILQHAEMDTPKRLNSTNLETEIVVVELLRERDDHSARTFGTYARKSRLPKDDNSSFDSSSDSCVDSDSSSNVNCSSSKYRKCVDDDVNLTDYEAGLESESPSPVKNLSCNSVITLDSDCCSENEKTFQPQQSSQQKSQKLSYSTYANGTDTKMDESNKSVSSSSGTASQSNSKNQSTTSRNSGKSSLQQETGSLFGKKKDDDDGDEEKSNFNFQSKLPDDASDEVDREEETEEEILTTPVIRSTKLSPKSRTTHNPKKRKRSGSGSSPPKKRSSKSVPIETMLEDDDERDNEICDAFLQSFLFKVQSVTDSKHPGLYTDFHKLLLEGQNVPDSKFLEKVQLVLKDFPDLVAEFASFLQNEDETIPPVNNSNFEECNMTHASLDFLKHLDKFTEKSPQLKSKILQKMRTLQNSNASEEETVDAITPYFIGNPVMILALQALYPSVHRLGTMASSNDFEEVDMEDEIYYNEDPNMEIIKLPEEKEIPATTTCPCKCHELEAHAFSARVKHCHKCCIKFQDGKVFAHNGRVVRPVNVELTSPSEARKILVGGLCGNCIASPPKSKDISSKTTEDIDKKTKTGELKTENNVALCTRGDVPSKIQDSESMEDIEQKPTSFTNECSDNSNATKVPRKAWTIEEDQILLEKCQTEISLAAAIAVLPTFLFERDITEIESRCVELLSLLQQSVQEEEDQSSPLNIPT